MTTVGTGVGDAVGDCLGASRDVSNALATPALATEATIAVAITRRERRRQPAGNVAGGPDGMQGSSLLTERLSSGGRPISVQRARRLATVALGLALRVEPGERLPHDLLGLLAGVRALAGFLDLGEARIDDRVALVQDDGHQVVVGLGVDVGR